MDQQTQLEYFARAVQLLGGNTATARALDINERTVRMFIAGDRRLHAGILEDIGKALIAHADECRALERKLSPAFAGNRTEAQEKPPLHDGKGRTRAADQLKASRQLADQLFSKGPAVADRKRLSIASKVED